jgi:hypothetical protein
VGPPSLKTPLDLKEGFAFYLLMAFEVKTCNVMIASVKEIIYW